MPRQCVSSSWPLAAVPRTTAVTACCVLCAGWSCSIYSDEFVPPAASTHQSFQLTDPIHSQGLLGKPVFAPRGFSFWAPVHWSKTPHVWATFLRMWDFWQKTGGWAHAYPTCFAVQLLQRKLLLHIFTHVLWDVSTKRISAPWLDSGCGTCCIGCWTVYRVMLRSPSKKHVYPSRHREARWLVGCFSPGFSSRTPWIWRVHVPIAG